MYSAFAEESSGITVKLRRFISNSFATAGVLGAPAVPHKNRQSAAEGGQVQLRGADPVPVRVVQLGALGVPRTAASTVFACQSSELMSCSQFPASCAPITA